MSLIFRKMILPGGPAFSYRRYEFLYANTKIDDISKKYSKLVEDISYDSIGIDAAQTPLTIKKNNGLFRNIHEAKLVDYKYDIST